MWVAAIRSGSATLKPVDPVNRRMSVLGAVRNPAHTGEQRCTPCTLVNLGILWIVVNVVVLLGTPELAAGLLAGGLAVIWLRGYLVPYTPRFAPQLVAATPIPTSWFHDTADPGSLAQTDTEEEAVVGHLQQTGIVEVDGQRVYLDEAFERRWHDEMENLVSLSLEALSDELSELPETPAVRPVTDDGQQWLAVEGQTSLVARHVAVAELGAARALEPVVDDPTDRLAMGRPLREFLDECPVCETPFEESSEVSCCGGYTSPREKPRPTLVCPECEQRFLRLPAE